MTPDPAPSSRDAELDDLRRRLDLLEDENQRLKTRMEPMFGPDNPAFDPVKFQRALQKPMLLVMLPVCLLSSLFIPLVVAGRQYLPRGDILGIPLIDAAGIGTRHPGMGIGILGFGGVGIGIIGVGGAGIGVFAFGGGSIGIVAVGGGSLGLIAFGGGACEYIAVGGGACGYYALG